MRRLRLSWVGLVLCLLVALLAAACGTKFELPTEQPGAVVIPSDGSYQMIATWEGMTFIRDVLLTHGTGSQLYLLFNSGVGGTAPRGIVLESARTVPRPIRTGTFQGLFNPIALCAGGQVENRPPSRIFVLDEGDTCLARQNPLTGTCDTTGRFGLTITHPEYYWRVHEYDLTGETAIGSFTDTSVSFVWGIAASDRGHVYVAGKAIIKLPNPFDPRLQERAYQDRIYRYRRGPLPGGGADPNIVGASWHRDRDFEILQGTGVGTVVEPRGIDWSRALGSALLVADFGKNWVQKMTDGTVDLGPSGYYRDGDLIDPPQLTGPLDVDADGQGYFYVVDESNARVLRYSDADRAFVQVVNVENNSNGLPLRRPVAVAADGDIVYIADREANEVIRYRKRP